MAGATGGGSVADYGGDLTALADAGAVAEEETGSAGAEKRSEKGEDGKGGSVFIALGIVTMLAAARSRA